MSDHSPPETPPSPLAPRSLQIGIESTPFVPSSAIKNHVVVSSKTTEKNKEEFEAELTRDVIDDLADTSFEPSAAIDDSSVHLQETMPSTDATTMTKEEFLEAKLDEVTADVRELIYCGLQILSEKEGIELKLLEANATAQEELANKDAVIANKDTVIANRDAVIANKIAELADKNAVIANKDTVIANRDAVLDKLGPFNEGEKVHVFWLEHSEVETGLAELWNGKILRVRPNDNYVITFRRNPRDSEYWDEVWHETAIRRGWLE